jgi:hypothetical protein
MLRNPTYLNKKRPVILSLITSRLHSHIDVKKGERMVVRFAHRNLGYMLQSSTLRQYRLLLHQPKSGSSSIGDAVVGMDPLVGICRRYPFTGSRSRSNPLYFALLVCDCSSLNRDILIMLTLLILPCRTPMF